jgi:hypothetical protein
LDHVKEGGDSQNHGLLCACAQETKLECQLGSGAEAFQGASPLFLFRIDVLKRGVYSFGNNFINKKLIIEFHIYSIGGMILFDRKEAIKIETELMEREILYLKGKRRLRAKRVYRRLLQECGKTCELDKPIYLKRSE